MLQETNFTEEAARAIVRSWSEKAGRSYEPRWVSSIRENQGNPYRVVTVEDPDGAVLQLKVFASSTVEVAPAGETV